MNSGSTRHPLGRECPTTRHNTTTTSRGMMGRRMRPWQQVGVVRPSPWTERCGPPPLASPRLQPGSTHWAATSRITTISWAWRARPIRTQLGLSLSRKPGNTLEHINTHMVYMVCSLYTYHIYRYTWVYHINPALHHCTHAHTHTHINTYTHIRVFLTSHPSPSSASIRYRPPHHPLLL